MADPTISTAQLFEHIGRLYVEVRARAANEAALNQTIASLAASQQATTTPTASAATIHAHTYDTMESDGDGWRCRCGELAPEAMQPANVRRRGKK